MVTTRLDVGPHQSYNLSTCYRKARNEYQQRFLEAPHHVFTGGLVLPATKGLTLWSPPNGTSPPATSSFGLDAALIFTCMHSSMLCIGCAHSADPSTGGNNRNQYLKLPTTSPFSPFPVLVIFLHSLVSAQCSYIALC